MWELSYEMIDMSMAEETARRVNMRTIAMVAEPIFGKERWDWEEEEEEGGSGENGAVNVDLIKTEGVRDWIKLKMFKWLINN